MPVVRFAAYQPHEQTRVDASNAMMALLAGAQLSSHLLKLTEGRIACCPRSSPACRTSVAST